VNRYRVKSGHRILQSMKLFRERSFKTIIYFSVSDPIAFLFEILRKLFVVHQ
jgi:hypothetical protein